MLCRPRVRGLPWRRNSSIFRFTTGAGIVTDVEAGAAAPPACAPEREDAVNDGDTVATARDDMVGAVSGRGADAPAQHAKPGSPARDQRPLPRIPAVAPP